MGVFPALRNGHTAELQESNEHQNAELGESDGVDAESVGDVLQGLAKLVLLVAVALPAPVAFDHETLYDGGASVLLFVVAALACSRGGWWDGVQRQCYDEDHSKDSTR